MPRKIFYSFHYSNDCWRTSTVRSIGSIEGNKPAHDNDWEKVKSGGDDAIKKWIASQLNGRSCTVVLIGEKTSERRWIRHEINESWNAGMGVVGIYIHGLKNNEGYISNKGKNPFDNISFTSSGKKLSEVVKAYNPIGTNSQERYAWIAKHLSNALEEAINIRKSF